MMSGPYERITESNAAVTRSAKNEDFDILDFLFAPVSLFSSINPIIQTFYAFLPIVYRTNNMCYDYPVIELVEDVYKRQGLQLLIHCHIVGECKEWLRLYQHLSILYTTTDTLLLRVKLIVRLLLASIDERPKLLDIIILLATYPLRFLC